MTFPYISQIQVNNCYTYQDFLIPEQPLAEFKHIVLTGRNGSGKTTILHRILNILSWAEKGSSRDKAIESLQSILKRKPNDRGVQYWEKSLTELNDINLNYITSEANILRANSNQQIIALFKAHRKVELKEVTTVTKEDDFVAALKKEENKVNLVSQFKQYLVNKKVYEAFDFMKANGSSNMPNKNVSFFDNLSDILRAIFNDNELTLEFIQESFEFYLVLKDKRKITFDQLSEGYSAFLSILMDLLMRTDLIRKAVKDNTFDPPGIVLIDEPETHFHLSMQYQILPMLSNLFPNIQFIVATHSPAIISSLKNAIVYDVSTKKEVSDWVVGSSFSELMVTHFGLENEYSNVAEQIIAAVQSAVTAKDPDRLAEILTENERFLTPSLRLEIESQIMALQGS